MVEFIKYHGVQYPVRISYKVIKNLKAETGKDIGSLDDMEILEPILYHGLISGCEAEGINMPFNRNEVENILDECMFEFIKIIPKFFNTEIPEDQTPVKKKVTK